MEKQQCRLDKYERENEGSINVSKNKDIETCTAHTGVEKAAAQRELNHMMWWF